VWKGAELRLRSRRGRRLAELVPDHAFHSMWRVRLPNGATTGMVNISRARDAAAVLALAALNNDGARS